MAKAPFWWANIALDFLKNGVKYFCEATSTVWHAKTFTKWCRSKKEKNKLGEDLVTAPFGLPPAVWKTPWARGNGNRGSGYWLIARVEENGIKHPGPGPTIQEWAERAGVWIVLLNHNKVGRATKLAVYIQQERESKGKESERNMCEPREPRWKPG